MNSLNGQELRTIYETVQRLEQVRKEEVKELSDLFTKDSRLIISPNNKCAGGCSHCVANSTPDGGTMSYESFARIDPKFFEIFRVADFGRKGNPLIYNSDGHDLVSLMKLLNTHGINRFTLALALQNHSIPVLNKLKEFAANKTTNIETMITYHHYYQDLDTMKLAQDFNSTLKNYIGFSNKIIISLLGDQYSQQNPSKAEEVPKTFQDNWKTIFRDIEMTSINGNDSNNTYHARLESKEIQIKIPEIDTRVYPLGRFRQYLMDKGILNQYETRFEQAMSDYVCPDLIKWPGIIIEPNGDLNLCASFEAVNCKGAVVNNIFNKSYAQVQDELIQFHKKEVSWFIDNLPGIIAGKVSTCKLKNKCYQ